MEKQFSSKIFNGEFKLMFSEVFKEREGVDHMMLYLLYLPLCYLTSYIIYINIL